MQANRPDEMDDYFKFVGDLRSSGNRESKMMLVGREATPERNYKVGLSGSTGASAASEDWLSPRHRHTFEQIRHPIEGDYYIRKDEVLPAGWVAYFPESAYYGPQIKTANLHMFSLQFGGPSGLGYWSMAQCKKALADLKAEGRIFENGICTWTDANGKIHNQDASEAVEERARGHAVDYPPTRYKELIMMNPAAFGWIKDRDLAGVGRKNFGTFTEREVKVSFIRVDKGASLPLGTESSAEVLFVKEGAVTHDNARYGRHATFGTEAEEKPVMLTAVEPTEFLYVKLPTF